MVRYVSGTVRVLITSFHPFETLQDKYYHSYFSQRETKRSEEVEKGREGTRRKRT